LLPLDALNQEVDPRSYDDIKALAKRLRVSVTELLAMSRKHDPFYAGTPSGRIHGQWFADLWQACGYVGQTNIHLRRMHYLVVTRFPDLRTADTSVVDPVRGKQRNAYPVCGVGEVSLGSGLIVHGHGSFPWGA